MAVSRRRPVSSAAGGADGNPSVVAEFRRSPGALWVERTRFLPRRSFEWMSRRVRNGLTFGVAARVEDGHGRILLVRMGPETSWTQQWVTPGGGGEPGETPREAVLREIGEEAGVHVKRLRLWKVFHEATRGPDGDTVRWDFLQYTALWSSGRPHTCVPDEIVEVRWFSRLPTNMAFRMDWVRVPRSFYHDRP